MEEKTKKVYVVVSQTGTILSRILKIVTKKEYNHVSLALDDSLEPMYAFGRQWAYMPFYGAFVKESRFRGTFYRFSKTKAVVLGVPVTEEQWNAVKDKLERTYENRKQYGYNYLALIWGLFNKPHVSKNRYYCSEFAREVLVETGIVEKEFFTPLALPEEFLSLPFAEREYVGLLKEYKVEKGEEGVKEGASIADDEDERVSAR